MTDTISEILVAIRAHLQAVADAYATGAPRSPAEQTCFDGLACDDAAPIAWLRTRLGLTPTEERVVWLLIAHELCPSARRFVRELNSEPVFDPTLDTILKVLRALGLHMRIEEDAARELETA